MGGFEPRHICVPVPIAIDAGRRIPLPLLKREGSGCEALKLLPCRCVEVAADNILVRSLSSLALDRYPAYLIRRVMCTRDSYV
jgi:hypothetical protein